MENFIPDKLYNELELEERGIGQRSTLRTNRWLGRGIPFIRCGRAVRYWGRDVIAYLQKNRIETRN